MDFLLPRLLAGLLICGLLAPPAPAAPGRRPDKEADLLARLQRESNPVKKARIEIRLGRLKLSEAAGAYEKGNVEAADRLLSAYLERMNSAWERLKSSRRQAHKRPAGFKDLDIALREDARYLDDLKHRVPYMLRAPVEKVATEVEKLRDEVLKALFPTEPPRKSGISFARSTGPSSLLRII
jgi:hypothetical protein